MKITHWGYDDWHGLFVDGVLTAEGHSIPMWELESTANGQAFTFEDKMSDERLVEYFSRYGRFGHKTLEEIERELETY